MRDSTPGKIKKVSKGEDLMVMLRLANFYIASIRKTLRAVNVMTARDLARIQKDGGVHVLSTPSKFLFKIWSHAYKFH